MIFSRPSHVYRRTRQVAQVLESLTKAIGPAVAALWIAWQYQQSLADKRVEATLRYVTRFEDAATAVGKAQRALSDALWKHADEIVEFRSTQVTEASLRKVRDTILQRVLDDARTAGDKSSVAGPLDELDDFYSALATCVQGRVCDRDSALKFFGCPAIEVARNFGTVFVDRRTVAPRYGWGASWIADEAKRIERCGG